MSNCHCFSFLPAWPLTTTHFSHTLIVTCTLIVHIWTQFHTVYKDVIHYPALQIVCLCDVKGYCSVIVFLVTSTILALWFIYSICLLPSLLCSLVFYMYSDLDLLPRILDLFSCFRVKVLNLQLSLFLPTDILNFT